MLLVGLVLTAGCKKDTPKESSEEPSPAKTGTSLKAAPTAPLDSPPECRKLCTVVGKCTLQDGKCIATSPEACRASFGCRTGGLCEVRDGKCAAVKDSDCEKSDLCEAEGRCVAVNGRCENKNTMPAGSAEPSGSAKPAGSAN